MNNYKVRAYLDWDGIPLESTVITYYYKHYWRANLKSWFLHHIFGYNCNTFKKEVL